MERPFEVDLVHGPADVAGVRVVPEQDTFLDHLESIVRDESTDGMVSYDEKVCMYKL